MKLKRIIGILTLLAAISMLILTFLILYQGVLFKAILVKSAIFNLTALIVLAGFYLIEMQEKINRIAATGIKVYGIVLLLFGLMVSFNIVDYQKTWNLLIGLGVIYIALIKLQLLHWEKSQNLLKILGLITILSNSFIAIFFLAKLNINALGTILDIAVIAAVFSFLIGLVLSRAKKLKQKN
ncbi:MAG: hypothetical protein WDZ35_11765 [Crocinitomicaceae bacterium]